MPTFWLILHQKNGTIATAKQNEEEEEEEEEENADKLAQMGGTTIYSHRLALLFDGTAWPARCCFVVVVVLLLLLVAHRQHCSATRDATDPNGKDAMVCWEGKKFCRKLPCLKSTNTMQTLNSHGGELQRRGTIIHVEIQLK